jgi:hypothetical protein
MKTATLADALASADAQGFKAACEQQLAAPQLTAVDRDAEIAKLKQLCVDRYDRGYDVFVECWDDAEWIDTWNQELGDVRAIKRLLARLVDVYNDRRADARNSAF